MLILLILAGEAAFLLPFVLPRIFRPTVLAVFEFDNTQLGSCFSVYGLVALAAYLLGGPVADRFAPRKLISIALVLTAVGGFALSTFPSLGVVRLIYGYWGFTTIFLLWAALLKATRQWGQGNNQGKAFGFLDGGRGLVSAMLGSFGVVLFSIAMRNNSAGKLEIVQQQSAFRNVILFTSALVALVGILVWMFLKFDFQSQKSLPENKRAITFSDMLIALRLPSVWMLMVIVLCGYVGYKVTDDLALYANEVMLLDEVRSAQIGTLLLYLRPVVGVAAGLLADWTRSATWIVFGFVCAMLGAIVIGTGVIGPGRYVLFFFALSCVCVGVYAIRSLYFAAMQEGDIPLSVTGTAIGLISVVGYTPDIFMGPLMGRLLDPSPGEPGHQNLFWLLTGFAFVGAIAALVFRQRYTK